MSSTSYGIQGNLCLTELPEPEPNQTSSITKLWGGGVVLDFQKADAEKMAMGVRVVPTADTCNMKVSGEVRPILLKTRYFLKWLEFDWNGLRDSVEFRMPKGCKASLVSFFSWWN
jgi:hypothetical protein